MQTRVELLPMTTFDFSALAPGASLESVTDPDVDGSGALGEARIVALESASTSADGVMLRCPADRIPTRVQCPTEFRRGLGQEAGTRVRFGMWVVLRS